jgi:hypothetical protein
MDQQANGERVQVMDLAPEVAPIAGKATETPNFKAWFGGSKVVDDTGAPMVLYHGTGSNIAEITPSAGTANSDAGFYVSPSAAEAGKYASLSDGGPNIVPVFASIRNPYFALTKSEISTGENGQMTVSDWGKLRAAGFDGVAIGITKDEYLSGAKKLSDAHELAVLNGRQIKSAIGNSGKFDPNSASLTDNPIADWGAGLKKALDDMRAEFEKSKPKQAKAPADTAPAATKTVAVDQVFNPAALATKASDLLAGGKTAGQVIGELEAGGTKVTPELQNMLVGASEFGGRINDLVDQVKALQAQRGVNAQGFDLIAQAVDNLRTGRTVEAKAPADPLEKALSDMAVRNPNALDAEIPIDFDADGKPGTRMTVRDYLDMVKREAAQDAADADLIEVAATCFLSGGM